MTHVPHDQLTPGLWYLRTGYPPFFTVVSLTPYAFGPEEGKLGVWCIDEEGSRWISDFADDQFIGKVPAPSSEWKYHVPDAGFVIPGPEELVEGWCVHTGWWGRACPANMVPWTGFNHVTVYRIVK